MASSNNKQILYSLIMPIYMYSCTYNIAVNTYGYTFPYFLIITPGSS